MKNTMISPIMKAHEMLLCTHFEPTAMVEKASVPESGNQELAPHERDQPGDPQNHERAPHQPMGKAVR